MNIGRIPQAGKTNKADLATEPEKFTYDPSSPEIQRLEAQFGREKLLAIHERDHGKPWIPGEQQAGETDDDVRETEDLVEDLAELPPKEFDRVIREAKAKRDSAGPAAP